MIDSTAMTGPLTRAVKALTFDTYGTVVAAHKDDLAAADIEDLAAAPGA